MATESVQVDPGVADEGVVRRAADLLKRGRLIVFPTETVYGLAASAASVEGLGRLRELKGRTGDGGKPFTVHVGSSDQADRLVGDLPALARRLARRAWPGPLTLVVSVDDPQTTAFGAMIPEDNLPAVYHDGTVGLRCPDLRFTQSLLERIEEPIVASSVNRPGGRPAMDAEETLAAAAAWNGAIDLVVDAGPTRFRQPSTVARVTGDRLEVLRAGVLDERSVRRLATTTVLLVCSGNTCRSPMASVILSVLLARREGCRPEDLPDRGFRIVSAGTAAGDGAPASAEAVTVAAERGGDLSRHRSTRLSAERIGQADYIWTMCASHARRVTQIDPSAADRTERLDPQQDIEDPMGSPVAAYRRCADQIAGALAPRLKELV